MRSLYYRALTLLTLSILFTSISAHELIHKGDTIITVKDSIFLSVEVPRGEMQWEVSSDETSWLEIAGETNNIIGIYIDSTAWYRLRVEAENCDPFYSDKFYIIEQTAPEIDSSVILIPKEIWYASIDTAKSDSLNFVFYKPEFIEDTVRLGNILVCEADFGYALRVVGISEQNDYVYIEVIEAALTEVFSHLNLILDKELSIDTESKGLSWYAEGVSVSSKGSNINFDINKILYDIDGDDQTEDDQFKLEGSITLSSDLSTEIKISRASLKKFYMNYDVEETLDLNAILTIPGINDSWNKKLISQEFTSFSIPVGPLFVIITPTLDVEIGAEINSSASVTCGVKQSVDFSAGVLYEHDKWTKNTSFVKKFDFEPPSIDGDMSIRPYVLFTFSFKIYRSLAPYLNAEGYFLGQLKTPDPSFYVYAGAKFCAGVKMDLFKKELFNHYTDLYGFEKLIYPGLEIDTLPPSILLTVSPTTLQVNEPLNVSLLGSSDDRDEPDELTFRFDWDGDKIWDTEYLSGLDFNHMYTEPGNYTVIVEGRDTEEMSAFAKSEITILGEGGNAAPVAVFNHSPSNPAEGDFVTLDASGVYDNETNTNELLIRWDIDGDDIWDTGWQTEKSFKTSYGSMGVYSITLEVKDKNNNVSSFLKNISIKKDFGEIENDLFVDSRDGNEYRTVKIGEQWWLAENLRYLPEVKPPSTGSYTESHYYVFNYEGSNVMEAIESPNYNDYGVLYNWPAAQDACPDGWKLPDDADFIELEIFLGMSEEEANRDEAWGRGTIEGGYLKDTGTLYWQIPNTGATNEVGFSALPAGARTEHDIFIQQGNSTVFWTTEAYGSLKARHRSLYYDRSTIRENDGLKENGYSVRCVKD